ncbi:hypothetical protein MRX96_043202 [Rhipicephalus microplus]
MALVPLGEALAMGGRGRLVASAVVRTVTGLSDNEAVNDPPLETKCRAPRQLSRARPAATRSGFIIPPRAPHGCSAATDEVMKDEPLLNAAAAPSKYAQGSSPIPTGSSCSDLTRVSTGTPAGTSCRHISTTDEAVEPPRSVTFRDAARKTMRAASMKARASFAVGNFGTLTGDPSRASRLEAQLLCIDPLYGTLRHHKVPNPTW